MNDYFIGLMSGTSLDGVDAVLVRFEPHRIEVVATDYQPYPAELKALLQAVCFKPTVELQALGELDARLGQLFAESAERLIAKAGVASHLIAAIGSHGQTVYHHPHGDHAFSLQIGDPNRIAQITGITTIADFRRRDIAAGGQGAPLVPAFHQAAFQSPTENRVIVNIGGIANLTVLPKDTSRQVVGFDSGPGNTLMDGWIAAHRGLSMDRDGDWARSGQVNSELLDRLLDDDYFRRAPPKSTGQEHFSSAWLETRLAGSQRRPEDVQASLCALTARSIADAVKRAAPDADRVLVCGGGSHNGLLMESLRELTGVDVDSTATAGLDPDWVEAVAFAWLARQTLLGLPGNLPDVTGARRRVILGGIYPSTGDRSGGE